MSILQVAIALLVCGGALAATGAVRPRVAIAGLVVAIAGTGTVADPIPGPAAILAGFTAAALAGYLGWVALRDAPGTAEPEMARPSGPSWPGWAGLAIIAFLAGWLTATAIGRTLAGPAVDGPSLAGVGAALAAGSPVARADVGASFALIALAIGPVLISRDILRLGVGLLLLVAAVQLLRAALVGHADDTVIFGFAILYASGGAGVAALARRHLVVHGDLEFHAEPPLHVPAIRSRHGDDAHPGGRGR